VTPDTNVYHASVSDFSFDKWSDDSDYTNDAFGARDLSPADGASGQGASPTLSGTLSEGVSTIDMYYECGDSSPDVLVLDDSATMSYSASASGTCYWQTLYSWGWGTETGDIYYFSSSGGLAISNVNSGNLSISNINSGNLSITVNP